MDDFRTEVDEHGNIKVMSYVEAVAVSKEEQEQARRIFKQLQVENAKLRELVHKQDALTKAVHAYWAGGGRSPNDFNVMMNANLRVLRLMEELGIEV